MKNPVKEAIRLSKVADVPVDLVAVEERLDVLNAISRNVLPVESGMPEIKEMRQELRLLKSRKQIAKYNEKGYPPFALEALTWRRENGFPKLMVYALEGNGKTEFFASNYGWSQWTPNLAPALRRQYKDFGDLIKARALDILKSITATSTYTGLIPADVKEAIKEAQPAFTTMWIVAETGKWDIKEVKEVPPVVRADPLIIGVRGRGVYLIAAYDTTTVEAEAERLSLAKVGE